MRLGGVRSGREAARGGRVFAAGLLLPATGPEAKAQGEPASDLCRPLFSADLYAAAVVSCREAAEAADAGAMALLGAMYGDGRGVPQDFGEALYWYRKGARAGDAVAMTTLGPLYEKGHGVPRDLVQAHLWYDLAAARETGRERGERAARNRDRVAARLGPEELARAQRLAREWRPGTATAALAPERSPAVPAPVEPDPAPALVREVQRRLAALDFHPGPADGVAGARTRVAVRAFERSRGLPESGRIDAALLERLRAAAGARP